MEVLGGASRSTASSGGFSPRHAPGCRVTGLLDPCFWSYCLRQVQAVAASTALPVLFILRLPGFLENCGFVGVDGGFSSGF